MAWALFEAARSLQDEFIEDQAFKLLQEALVSKTDDISLENGMSGIGYVLLYLIRNNFVDADFDELFSEQLEKILTNFVKQKENPNTVLNAVKLNYFLNAVKPYRTSDKRIDEIIKSIFEANELYFSVQFFDFKDINYINNKASVLSKFETYLKTVYDCGYVDYSQVILDDYVDLYRTGRVKSSYKVAHFLEKLDKEEKHKDVISENKQFSVLDDVKNISLRDHIELSQLTGNEKFLNLLLTEKESEIEKVILRLIPPGALKSGYEQGVSQLLMNISNNEVNLI